MSHRSKNAGSKNAKWIDRGPNGEKTCSKCRHKKPLEDFCIDKSRFDGRSYVCRACKLSSKPGPSKPLRQAKMKDGIRWCRGCGDWTAIGKNGLCRSHANEDARQRYGNDPEFRKRRQKRSAARRRGVMAVPISAQDMILETFDGRCAYCGDIATTWDHVVAVRKGGLTEPGNIVPACVCCNSSKRTQDVWEWMARRGITPSATFIEEVCKSTGLTFVVRGPTAFD